MSSLSVTDRRLKQRINQLYNETTNSNHNSAATVTINIDSLLRNVTQKWPEYGRKDKTVLRKFVEEVVREAKSASVSTNLGQTQSQNLSNQQTTAAAVNTNHLTKESESSESGTAKAKPSSVTSTLANCESSPSVSTSASANSTTVDNAVTVEYQTVTKPLSDSSPDDLNKKLENDQNLNDNQDQVKQVDSLDSNNTNNNISTIPVVVTVSNPESSEPPAKKRKKVSSLNRALGKLYATQNIKAKNSNQANNSNDKNDNQKSSTTVSDSNQIPINQNQIQNMIKNENTTTSDISNSTKPLITLSSVAGVDRIIEDLKDLILYPLMYPDVYKKLCVSAPTGILLVGPPGSGKSLMLDAVAGSLSSTSSSSDSGSRNSERPIGIPTFHLIATEIVSSMSGESESKLRKLFTEVKNAQPSLLLIDELDAITPRRDLSDGRQMDKRIVSQLLSCLDSLQNEDVVVLAATSRVDNIDSSLRRAGRFDREIQIGIPNNDARHMILKKLLEPMIEMEVLADDVNIKQISDTCGGYVGADLKSLVQESALACVKEYFEKREKDSFKGNSTSVTVEGHLDVDMTTVNSKGYSIDKSVTDPVMTIKDSTKDSDPNSHLNHLLNPQDSDTLNSLLLSKLKIHAHHFKIARKKVQPSAQREGFATSPNVSWDSIGALSDLKKELNLSVIAPIKYPELFRQFSQSGNNGDSDSDSSSSTISNGVMLYGAPGCGKTLVAKALASATHANFISIKGPELLNKYVGESERAVRSVFQRASASAPCIVFFDELDALAPRREGGNNGGGGGGNSGSGAERVVNQLLTELDGVNSSSSSSSNGSAAGNRNQVYVIGASNRPDIIDPALLRPGRLGKLIHVPMPDETSRKDILKSILRCRNKNSIRNESESDSSDIDIDLLAKRTDGFSGADLTALVKESTMIAMREYLSKLMMNHNSKQESMLSETGESNVLVNLDGPLPDNIMDLDTSDSTSSSSGNNKRVTQDHFLEALKKMRPSVSASERERYRQMALKIESEGLVG